MMPGGMTSVKYLLFIFNLLFMISGIAILVIGVAAIHPYKQYSMFVDGKFAAGPIILIVVGVTIFVIAIVGCRGAIKENNWMLVTYAVLLLTLFCIQLAAFNICGFMYQKDVKKNAERELRKSMEQYYVNEEVNEAWNVLQKDLKCCGIDGPGDWRRKGMAIPKSCCDHSEDTDECKVADTYWQGCSPVLKKNIEHFASIIGGVAIGIAFVQLLGVILACWLARLIHKENKS